MDRYNVIENKFKREIVLLKGHPCIWGKCRFCDYIDDNGINDDEINDINFNVLSNVTGKYGTLEVINSGSCFEIPKKTLIEIKRIVDEKNIRLLSFESHWCYRKRLQEMRDFFGIPIIFKIGVETFDNDFRNGFLNKNANFKSYEEVKEYFQSVCLMVGIKGQTREMISNDIDIVTKYFDHGTINIFTENTTDVKRDDELISWFEREYSYLKDNDKVEVLFHNTDFGVGD